MKLQKNELIGLRVTVRSSQNPLCEGIDGVVIDETKHTLLVKTDKGAKRLIKKVCVFDFHVGSKIITIAGENLLARPYERVKRCKK